MNKNFDLSLPEWGTYNKEYAGFSHITNKDEGIRLDIDIFPGFFRRSVLLPRTVADTGAKMLAASPDLSHVLYRYEMQWKDMIYCDVHMFEKDGSCKLVCDFVNNTDSDQSLQMDLTMSLRYPTFCKSELKRYEVQLPKSAIWINSSDYAEMKADCQIPIDGFKRGEYFISDFVNNRGICHWCFNKQGDTLTYKFEEIEADSINIRYIASESADLELKIGEKSMMCHLPSCEKPSFYTLRFEKCKLSEFKLINCSKGISLDGFSVGINSELVRIEEKNKGNIAKVKRSGNIITLKYPDAKKTYTVTIDCEDYVLREFFGDDIGNMLLNNTHRHDLEKITEPGDGYFFDIFMRPVFLKPHTKKRSSIQIDVGKCEKISEKVPFFTFTPNKDGRKYLMSQNIMAAVTMTNVVYPIFCKGGYIKHNTPGKNWDSLYTWDSGFIGLGLLTVDQKRAFECLNTYLTSADDTDTPFILHGSPVPTQSFLYQELFNSGYDKNALKAIYPSMRRYCKFFYDIRNKENGLIHAWNLFYNSGGWDDYPPQCYIHDKKLEDKVYPIIITAMAAIFSKLLLMFAEEWEFAEDADLYRGYIACFEKAMQSAWDNKSGYFGYALCGSNGKIEGILKTNSGENYNKGMDGVYPYISSSCTDEQKRRIIENIEKGMMTPVGVSVVDTTASYFRHDGYWNGSVWMPHQWILWKALLDNGQCDLADKIAMTALELWKDELELSYNCYELFMINNRRGAGFSQFSGLSAPVLAWYNSYFMPGSISTGFGAIITESAWSDGFSFAKFTCRTYSDCTYMLICMNEKYDYTFENVAEYKKINRGAYRLKIKSENKKAKITVHRRK